MKTKNKRAFEKGSALVYILIAIALLAALTVSFMEPSSQQTTSQNAFKTVSSIQGQIDTIRSAVQECILLYPNGDSTIDTSGSGTDIDANTRYPISPNSTHLPAALRSGDRLARNIRCPGNNGGTGNENQHEKLFSGGAGKFLAPAPDLFEDWQYYNGTDGVFYWVRTTKSDAFVASALAKLDEKFSECEADVIDTSEGASGNKALDSAGTVNCTHPASGSALCFRVWLVQNATAVYNGDADSDENTNNPPDQTDCS